MTLSRAATVSASGSGCSRALLTCECSGMSSASDLLRLRVRPCSEVGDVCVCVCVCVLGVQIAMQSSFLSEHPEVQDAVAFALRAVAAARPVNPVEFVAQQLLVFRESNRCAASHAPAACLCTVHRRSAALRCIDATWCAQKYQRRRAQVRQQGGRGRARDGCAVGIQARRQRRRWRWQGSKASHGEGHSSLQSCSEASS
jgi:hypothetical protein